MIHQTLTLAILCLLASASYSQNRIVRFSPAYETPSSEIIKEKSIKREFIYRYNTQTRKYKDSTLAVIIDFNPSGRVVHRSVFGDSGEIKTSMLYVYNESGQLSSITYSMTFPKTGMSRKQFFYDSAGNETACYTFNEDTSFMYIEKKIYDDKNRLISLFIKPGKQDWRISEKFTYNNRGDLAEHEFYELGNFKYSYSYLYDTVSRTKTSYKKEGMKKAIFYGVEFYDSLNRCVRSRTPFEDITITHYRDPILHNDHSTSRTEILKSEDFYIYNQYGAVSEHTQKVNNGMKWLTRYYYVMK